MEFPTLSKSYQIAFLALLSAFVILLAFKIGEIVGFRKAAFSFNWGDRYHENFGGPRAGFFGDFEGRGIMNAHGTFGTILKIDGNVILMKDADNSERALLVNDRTVINRMNNLVKISDLTVDERITAIGDPNPQGQIVAKFIRAFPPPPPSSMQGLLGSDLRSPAERGF